MDEAVESWQHKIRALASAIEHAEFGVFKADADVRRLQAQLELRAMSSGAKTISMQKTISENDDNLYQARLNHGMAKGALSGLRIQLKSVEVGFKEWQSKNANMRNERTRYGA